jgi:outer membrane protein assembly factor BamA
VYQPTPALFALPSMLEMPASHTLGQDRTSSRGDEGGKRPPRCVVLGVALASALAPSMSVLRLCARFAKLLVLASLLFLLGCNKVPAGRMSVDDVTVRGAKKVDADDVADKVATTESPKFLGLFRGVIYDYSVFDRNVLQRDLARVEAFYRTKGYYDAHARAGRIHVIDDKHVRVEIVVEEGEPVTVRNVRVDGLENVPADIAAIAQREAKRTLPEGRAFEQEAFDNAIGAVRRALTDRGYAYTKVEHDASVDIVQHKVDVVLRATPGEPCVFGAVTLEGLGKLPADPVYRAIDIEPGTPYSEATVDAAQQAVLDLGVFATVDITPDLPDPPRADRVVPIKVKLEPTRLKRVRVGGGIEFDALKTDVHGLVGWEHRNFFGGLRTFSVTFKPGVVLYPLRVNNLAAPNQFFPEERLRLEFRQPGFLEARTNAFIRPEFNIQALLLNPDPPPDQRVIGYAEFRNGIGVDRSYWKLYGALSHNLQVAYPFAYSGTRDPTLGTLLISYPELITTLDFRDDRIHPRKGVYLLNTLQVAGGPFGGQAADVKIQPDARAYIPLAKHVVLAVRGSLGFLMPRNYGDRVRGQGPGGTDPSEARTRDYQLTFFRGFFSGGPTSNRGYPLRGVGPHDDVPFLSPEIEAQRINAACAGEYDCRSPTGGFTLWEASTEVRFKVTGPLSAAIFCDASDVSPRTMNVRLTHLHLACGGGGRYDTPVGPVRLDVGYRIPGMQVLGGLTRDEKRPETFAFGIPIAVSLGIGEAY